MKKISFISICLVLAALVFAIVSCNKEVLQDETSSQVVYDNNVSMAAQLAREIFTNYPNADYDFIEDYVYEKMNIDKGQILLTKSESEYNYCPSQEALNLYTELYNVDASLYTSKEEFIFALNDIINSQSDNISSDEIQAIKLGVSVAAEIIDIKYYQTITKNWWTSWGKCAAGITGGAILGALAGAGVAAIETLGIGAVPGAIIGGIGGGLSGAAAAC